MHRAASNRVAVTADVVTVMVVGTMIEGVVMDEVGEAGGAVTMLEKVETAEIDHGRGRTRRDKQTMIGNGVMTRRWRGAEGLEGEKVVPWPPAVWSYSDMSVRLIRVDRGLESIEQSTVMQNLV